MVLRRIKEVGKKRWTNGIQMDKGREDKEERMMAQEGGDSSGGKSMQRGISLS